MFVQKAFQSETKSENLQYLQDFHAEFSSSLGKTFDASVKGLGVRSGRYSLYAENGEIKQFFEESNPGEMTVTDADTLLGVLK